MLKKESFDCQSELLIEKHKAGKKANKQIFNN